MEHRQDHGQQAVPNKQFDVSTDTKTHPLHEVSEESTPSAARYSSAYDEKWAMLDGWWPFEIFALLCSGLALAAIVIILRVYNHHPQPGWTAVVSLNTVISWLSTVAKACVLLPISVTMGQLRWIYFSRERRPLSQLQIFDAASRGVLGSGRLLFITKWTHLASVACVVTILCIGFEPFIQNLVHYHPRRVVDETLPATVANTFLYRGQSPGNRIGNQTPTTNIYIDPILKANLYNGVLSTDDEQPWAIPKFFCSTGNCTWTDVTTFFVQPSCRNLTAGIVTSCNSTTQQCTTSAEDGTSLTYSTLPRGTSDKTAFEGLRTSVQLHLGDSKIPYLPEITYIMVSDGPAAFADPNEQFPVSQNSSFVAMACTLDLCTQLVDISVDNSQYSEVQKRVYCDKSYANTTSSDSDITLHRDWGLEKNGASSSLAIDSFSYRTTALFLVNIFFGAYVSISGTDVASANVFDWRHQVYDVHPTGLSLSAHNPYASSDVMEAIWYGNISRCAPTNDHLACAFTNVAKAMTKSLRDSAFTSTAIDNPQSSIIVDNGSRGKLAVGRTYIFTTFVRIDWYWISLPCLVWILSAITWASTVWKTRREGIPNWRDNQLPLLSILPHQLVNEGQSHTSVSNRALRRWASGVYVKLHVDRDGAYLE